MNGILLSNKKHIVEHAALWLHKWREEDIHNVILAEVREWLQEHGGTYDLTAKMVKSIVYNSTKRYDTRTSYSLRVYVDFHDPTKLMLFKLTF